ncbi:MAG: DUF4386 domain-containing protein [Acidobacteria bacterium]|nr:MAG: DUF4386 domain-containing protein [Acidobacteriota bacterium]
MTSLSKNARVAGLLYILASVVGVVRLLYIPSALIVHGNAAATVNNIAAHELLFRLSIVSYLLSSVLFTFLTLALYRLFKGVDLGLAVLMVILGGLMPVPIFFVNSVTDVAVLLFARGSDFLSAFDKPQREAFVMLFLNLHHHLDLANAIFWGLWLFPFGLLVYRSRFLPRFFGVWLILACLAWLAFSFTGFMFPGYEDKVFTLGQPFTLGEVATMLWLAIMGAREPRVAAAVS